MPISQTAAKKDWGLNGQLFKLVPKLRYGEYLSLLPVSGSSCNPLRKLTEMFYQCLGFVLPAPEFSSMKKLSA